MFYLLKVNNGTNNVGDVVEATSNAGTTAKLCAAYTAEGALATGDATVEYVCVEGGEGKEITAGGKFLAIPVNSDMIFKTTASGAVTVGKAYTIANGDSITTTAASAGKGALVVAVEGAEIRVKLKY